MRNNIESIILIFLLLLGGCDALDLVPKSYLTDANFWRTAGHYSSFKNGLHSRFRTHNYNFFLMGEGRSDTYGDLPLGGGASAGYDQYPDNTISPSNTLITNYGGFYTNINQLNLMILKATHCTVPIGELPEDTKNYYLGQAYGMRAFYYFHLLRVYGSAVIQTEATTAIDPTDLAKPTSPDTDVMLLIKNDIEESLKAFNKNYTFNGKGEWSKSATLMLKSEVYLWTSRQMGGGVPDATEAKNALLDIQHNVPELELQASFKDVFDYTRKGNKEIIFASVGKINEYLLWGDSYLSLNMPSATSLSIYYDIATKKIFDTSINNENILGGMRIGVKKDNFDRFDDKDSRKLATLKGVYARTGTEGAYNYTLVAVYPYKYQGTQEVGKPTRTMADDYPIYRYADLLLLLAEAKSLLGESPATEINLIRKRAYGNNYSANIHGFGKMPYDHTINDAILEERFKEFMFEGKRWYDLRRFGSSYVYKYTKAEKNNDLKFLWPIDPATLSSNPALEQTPGY